MQILTNPLGGLYTVDARPVAADTGRNPGSAVRLEPSTQADSDAAFWPGIKVEADVAPAVVTGDDPVVDQRGSGQAGPGRRALDVFAICRQKPSAIWLRHESPTRAKRMRVICQSRRV